MNLETYTSVTLPTIRRDLKAMCIHENVIQYVEAACRQAYGMGDRDGYKQATKDTIEWATRSKPQVDLIHTVKNITADIRRLAADGRDC